MTKALEVYLSRVNLKQKRTLWLLIYTSLRYWFSSKMKQVASFWTFLRSSSTKALSALHSWQTRWWYQKTWSFWGKRLISHPLKEYSTLCKTQPQMLPEQSPVSLHWRSPSPAAMLSLGCSPRTSTKSSASLGATVVACSSSSRREAPSCQARSPVLLLPTYELFMNKKPIRMRVQVWTCISPGIWKYVLGAWLDWSIECLRMI